MILVTFENYKEYLNKPVDVDIRAYAGGILYPDDNILLGMNSHYYYFYSTTDDCYWHEEVNPKDKLDKSVEVYVQQTD